MAEHENLKTAAELDDALRLLDHELSGLRLETPLVVRAIGGYALMKHGVRSEERAYTLDIDTVTGDYNASVLNAISVVAEKLGLDEDWLNNYNVIGNDPEQVEQMLQADWIPQPMELRNIAVSIASVETLTRSKIMAVDDVENSGRERDVPDLQELLAHQGITTMQQFSSRYPDPFQEFPTTAKLMRDHLNPGGAGVTRSAAIDRFPELQDLDLDEFADLSSDIDAYAGDDLYR